MKTFSIRYLISRQSDLKSFKSEGVTDREESPSCQAERGQILPIQLVTLVFVLKILRDDLHISRLPPPSLLEVW
jgi:hypothetical protein